MLIRNVGHLIQTPMILDQNGDEIELAKLDSRSETYFISEDLPHKKFINSKAKNKLGWIPRNKLKPLWSYDE